MSPLATTKPLWATIKTELKTLFPEDVFQLWFEPIECLDANDDTLTLGVPNDFAAIWISDNYLDLIIQRIRLATGRDIAITFRKHQPSTTAAPASRLAATAAPAPADRHAGTTPTPTAQPYPRRYQPPAASSSLNPRNTFGAYVVGSNNQMAHAAALAVAQAPAQAYNPLFIYGETGLGKTHLMHAIGHAILQKNPHAKVAYLSTEKFTNEFIQALQENALTKFRQRYRHVDVLLLDDIQFLGGKERIQEEFFHTFNELFESQKQVVLSSDRRASEIQKLEARLVSRFEWGLPADIQAPDYETRLAILRTKARTLKFDLPDDVAAFIAKNIAKNIRRLEGALIKVASYATLTGKPLDLPATEMLLQDVLMEQVQNLLTIEVIQKRVADHYQIRHTDMTSKRRPANIAFARQVAMYLSRLLTKHPLQEIGDAFGGRDHGTVIHAVKTVENMMEQDPTARDSVKYLKTQLSR